MVTYGISTLCQPLWVLFCFGFKRLRLISSIDGFLSAILLFPVYVGFLTMIEAFIDPRPAVVCDSSTCPINKEFLSVVCSSIISDGNIVANDDPIFQGELLRPYNYNNLWVTFLFQGLVILLPVCFFFHSQFWEELNIIFDESNSYLWKTGTEKERMFRHKREHFISGLMMNTSSRIFVEIGIFTFSNLLISIGLVVIYGNTIYGSRGSWLFSKDVFLFGYRILVPFEDDLAFPDSFPCPTGPINEILIYLKLQPFMSNQTFVYCELNNMPIYAMSFLILWILLGLQILFCIRSLLFLILLRLSKGFRCFMVERVSWSSRFLRMELGGDELGREIVKLFLKGIYENPSNTLMLIKFHSKFGSVQSDNLLEIMITSWILNF